MKKFILVNLLLILGFAGAQAQDSFSTQLKHHVQTLTQDKWQGRAAGSLGEKEAATYIAKQFEKAGLELLYPGGFQDFSLVVGADTLHSQNVVAVVQGYDSKYRDEYIVVGAHYDHLGTYTMKVNGKDSVCIYPGADANASGVAALLELAAVAQAQHYMFKRSLLFVAFGAEEQGAVGSWYFANRAFPIASVKMMINLDRMGRNAVDNYPMAYTCGSHYALEKLLQETVLQPYMPSVSIFTNDCFNSDHQVFLEKDIPVCLFTTGMHPQYHTLRDTPDYLDYGQMDGFCRYIAKVVTDVANGPDDFFQQDVPVATPAGEETVYASSDVDKAPRFLNAGVQSFADAWIYKYLKYPEEAVRNGIKGRVMVSFIVEKNGEVTHAEVARSVDSLLDEEAVRVVAASPKWKPGEKNGEKVRVKIVIPVYFELTKGKKSAGISGF